jgi:hypothetical protein
MFGKYNGFVSKARVSACMYFLVTLLFQPKTVTRPFLMRNQVFIRQIVPLLRVPKVENEILLHELQKNAMTTKLEQKTSSQEKSKKVWRLPTIPQ